MSREVDKFDTTIGELVAALSDVGFGVCANQRQAYFLVALALKSLLGRAQGDKVPHVAVESSHSILHAYLDLERLLPAAVDHPAQRRDVGEVAAPAERDVL